MTPPRKFSLFLLLTLALPILTPTHPFISTYPFTSWQPFALEVAVRVAILIGAGLLLRYVALGLLRFRGVELGRDRFWSRVMVLAAFPNAGLGVLDFLFPNIFPDNASLELIVGLEIWIFSFAVLYARALRRMPFDRMERPSRSILGGLRRHSRMAVLCIAAFAFGASLTRGGAQVFTNDAQSIGEEAAQYVVQKGSQWLIDKVRQYAAQQLQAMGLPGARMLGPEIGSFLDSYIGSYRPMDFSTRLTGSTDYMTQSLAFQAMKWADSGPSAYDMSMAPNTGGLFGDGTSWNIVPGPNGGRPQVMIQAPQGVTLTQDQIANYSQNATIQGRLVGIVNTMPGTPYAAAAARTLQGQYGWSAAQLGAPGGQTSLPTGTMPAALGNYQDPNANLSYVKSIFYTTAPGSDTRASLLQTQIKTQYMRDRAMDCHALAIAQAARSQDDQNSSYMQSTFLQSTPNSRSDELVNGAAEVLATVALQQIKQLEACDVLIATGSYLLGDTAEAFNTPITSTGAP